MSNTEDSGTEDAQAAFFMLDLINQELRAQTTQLGENFWTESVVNPIALVGIYQKYYPRDALAHFLARGGDLWDLGRQQYVMGFLLGAQWQRENET